MQINSAITYKLYFMKSQLLLHSICLFLGLGVFTGPGTTPVNKAREEVFQRGEEITYTASYGVVNALEARFRIDENLYQVNGRPCHKVEVTGKSVGVFGASFTVDNLWRSFIDLETGLSQKFYRNVTEGRYKLDEITYFDQNKRTLVVTANRERALEYTLEQGNIHDIISAYFHLRTIDFSDMSEGDIIKVYTFLDTKPYNFQLRFAGREVVKTKLGRYKAIKLVPLVPSNKIFRGSDPLTIWISDDVNKLPLKAEASLLLGAAELQITSASNLREPLGSTRLSKKNRKS
jgi:hypothetical protein